jgi:hypothetical protein
MPSARMSVRIPGVVMKIRCEAKLAPTLGRSPHLTSSAMEALKNDLG